MEASRLRWGRLGPQSRAQRGAGRPKGTSYAATGGLGTVILRSSKRLCSKDVYFLKCGKTSGRPVFFSGVRGGQDGKVGATWAPKWCPRGVRTGKRSLRAHGDRPPGRVLRQSCHKSAEISANQRNSAQLSANQTNLKSGQSQKLSKG